MRADAPCDCPHACDNVRRLVASSCEGFGEDISAAAPAAAQSDADAGEFNGRLANAVSLTDVVASRPGGFWAAMTSQQDASDGLYAAHGDVAVELYFRRDDPSGDEPQVSGIRYAVIGRVSHAATVECAFESGYVQGCEVARLYDGDLVGWATLSDTSLVVDVDWRVVDGQSVTPAVELVVDLGPDGEQRKLVSGARAGLEAAGFVGQGWAVPIGVSTAQKGAATFAAYGLRGNGILDLLLERPG